MRRAISIFLLLCILANVAGFYVYSYFRLMEIRRQMNEELARTSPELFQRITLSRAEYDFFREGDDEVEWQGSMYDIGTIKFDGDTVEILALRDVLETDLLGFVSKLIKASSEDSKAPSHAFTQYLSLEIVLPKNLIQNITACANSIIHNTLYLRCEYAVIRNHTTPPPQI